MKNIAIIPARSASKGLPNKNIKELNGKPLLAYTIQAALESGLFEKVMVSTDSDEYAKIAIAYGAEVPFLRSSENSRDNASSWGVVKEVLQSYELIGETFDVLALLQPTSPLRGAADILSAFQLMEERRAKAIISVCQTDPPIEQSNILPDDLSLVGFYDDRKYMPRQARRLMYHPNGAIYLYRVDAFFNQETIYDDACYAYIMNKIHSIDIDDIEDFLMAESILKNLEQEAGNKK